MSALVVLLILVAIGLELNHRRRSPLAGRTDSADRDAERLRAELRWVAGRQP
jgi:hypothetical protein